MNNSGITCIMSGAHEKTGVRTSHAIKLVLLFLDIIMLYVVLQFIIYSKTAVRRKIQLEETEKLFTTSTSSRCSE